MQLDDHVEFELPCRMCGAQLLGQPKSGSCPECGLHVSRSIAEVDAQRILEPDELSDLIPALKDVFAHLADAERLLEEAKDAQQAARQQIVTAAIQAGDRLNVRKSILRYLYWDCPAIKATWLAEAFDVNQYQMRQLAGTKTSESTCGMCGGDIERSSRSGENTYIVNRRALCAACKKVQERQRQAEWDQSRREDAERRRLLQTMPYREYLQTEEWQARRKRQLKSAHYKCQVCNASDIPLDVHHRTYERRGHENFKDLLVLCRTCHDIFHREDKIKV